MRYFALILFMLCTQAYAEDDYTLKEWCRQFRPKSCKLALYNDEGLWAKRECDKDTIVAIEKHPECEKQLNGFRKAAADEVFYRLELEENSRMAFGAMFKVLLNEEKARRNSTME